MAVSAAKRMFALLLAALCLCMPTLAAGEAESTEPDDSRFVGKTWEEVVADFFAERYINAEDTSIAIGYYNTVTGEEHYINGDQIMVGGSVYKLPLNMYYSEKVYEGEMTMDTLILSASYEVHQKASLIMSDNTTAEILQNQFPSYRDYRAAIGKYLGVAEGDKPENDPYYLYNCFTAEQMIHCLKMLYAEPERYPGVLDCMKQAYQDNFFCLKEQRYQIAHKHGYLDFEEHLYLNDCAIIYTEQPILLAVFQDNVMGGLWTLTDLCTLMCDYTNYQMSLPPPTPEPTPTPTPTPSPEPTPEATPVPTPEPTPLPTPEPEVVEEDPSRILGIIGGALGLLGLTLMALTCVRRKRKEEENS